MRVFPRPGREPLEIDASMLSISGHLELEASLLAAHLAEVEDVPNSLGKKADRLEAEANAVP